MKITEEMLDLAEKAYDGAVYCKEDTCFTHALAIALEAALASIPDPEPLSDDKLTEEERLFVERLRGDVYIGNFPIALAIIDRIAPKPEPKKRTAQELAAEIHACLNRGLTVMAELVALAEKNK